MSEVHTIKTKNSRKLYIPYYFAFVSILLVSAYLTFQGKLALPALGAAAVMVFLGANATELHRVYQTYEINPGSVVHTTGYISKHSKRIDLFAINDVTVTQNIFQRIFNFGDIHIHVANASHQTILRNLHAPKVFAETIQNNMHKARNKLFENDDYSSKPVFKQPENAETSDDLEEI